ncbi:proline iminopeptidase [Roseivirga ehrenbergii]|uniref:AB hydrolase-1 domain-containing protein n=1 Tax=Roseivirga ehrenbergii (strain DSM 102268 / JCM 13514 / KCTC 12282 / NCIMB 14502 / KMM 6017) TaxID=279360 RepID=A0A150XT29_ROSEK|nr:proline iminopeptidase-family hydrolase [Roseivirga ehrenbergii]KYG81881.1 hypothetical protein MB14_00365 [Roseivirga ehrenbergii]TCL01695.1 proline iminopeptidase [Roseivirga ehrenbergii]
MRTLLLLAISSVLLGCQFSKKEILTTTGFLEINGSQVYYKTMGQGEPLVIVHGGPVMEHSYFLPHFEELAKDYQLIFYDQRACGQSSVEVQVATMNLNGFVEDLEQIRQAMKLEKINLFGHSWGGLLAMKYGIKYPENLNHLILSNSIAPSVADWQLEGGRISERATNKDREDRQTIMESGALQTVNPSKAIEKLLRISFRPQMYDTTNLSKLKLFVPQDYMQRSQVFGLLGSDLTDFNLYSDLKKITCPTLIIYGSEEPAASLHAEQMTDSFPNGQLSIIQKSGHFPFVENEKQFFATIQSFLEK